MRRKKQDELIPLEKARRVIYMESRGSMWNLRTAGGVLLMALGIICILYCIGILLFVNYGTKFFLVWGVGGSLLVLAGWLVGFTGFLQRLPVWARIGAGVLLGIALLVFLAVEGLILGKFSAKAPEDADYCVILGAQMRSFGPSDVLRRRLDAAAAYLKENPDTRVIVSGGQGANEPMTEAEGMYEYLVAAGISPDRILREEESANTYENLKNSSRFLDREKDRVVVVTSNFHVYRALGIARKLGYENADGLAADSYPLMVPNNLLREFFGVLKDLLVGNL